MTLVTYAAEALAALIIGGVCMMMYFDLPLQAQRVHRPQASR